MKKVLAILVGVVLIFVCGSAAAQQGKAVKYELYLGPTDTGVTTPSKLSLSGVTSPLLFKGGNYSRRVEDTTLKEVLSYLPSGNGMLYIDTVTASIAQRSAGGTYTGNTFFVCAKYGHAGSNLNLLEKIPIVHNVAMSGDTAYGIPFEIPPGTERIQFFFGPSGITNYGNFKATVVVGLPGTDWKPPPAFVIGSATLTMIAGASTGVSTIPQMFTGSVLPQGTQYVTVQVQSGGSVFYTSDGITTPVSTGTPVGTSVPLGSAIETTGVAAKNTTIRVGATTTTIHAMAWSRDPWK